jgi:hypothetical protein
MQQASLDTADTKIITCPSGLVGTVRNLTVGESRVLTGKRRDSTAQLNQLLSACWVETLDPGPYALDEGRLAWPKVLQGDRFFALMQIRILTYGAAYEFGVPCQNRMCSRRIDWSLSLDDLAVRKLSDASREAFMRDNHFDAPLPGGKRAHFGLPIGEDETRMTRIQQGNEDASLPVLLNLRVREVSDVPPLQKAAYLSRLSLRQARDLLAAFDRADCGVETDIDVECPHCGYTQSVSLPLDQGFLWPQSQRTSSPSAA